MQFWMVVDMPVGVQTTGFGQTVQKNCAFFHKVVDVTRCGRPCEYAATQDVRRDAFCVIFGFFMVIFLGPSWHSFYCVLSRAGGWRRRRELNSRVSGHQGVPICSPQWRVVFR